jgi:hypothetical protein
MMMEVISSRETSALIRAAWHYVPEDGFPLNHRHEDLKSYIALTGWALWRGSNVSPVRYKLGFIYQKTTYFIVTAVKTSNLT